MLSYLLLRRMAASPTVCRYIILLTVAVPWVVCLSVTLMAEMTFACLLTAALLILTRLDEGENLAWEPLFWRLRLLAQRFLLERRVCLWRSPVLDASA